MNADFSITLTNDFESNRDYELINFGNRTKILNKTVLIDWILETPIDCSSLAICWF
jgi:hypothetical protein